MLSNPASNAIEIIVELCEKLSSALGIELDPVANNNRGKELLVSTPSSKVKVFVIPTNEEIVMSGNNIDGFIVTVKL